MFHKQNQCIHVQLLKSDHLYAYEITCNNKASYTFLYQFVSQHHFFIWVKSQDIKIKKKTTKNSKMFHEHHIFISINLNNHYAFATEENKQISK